MRRIDLDRPLEQRERAAKVALHGEGAPQVVAGVGVVCALLDDQAEMRDRLVHLAPTEEELAERVVRGQVVGPTPERLAKLPHRIGGPAEGPERHPPRDTRVDVVGVAAERLRELGGAGLRLALLDQDLRQVEARVRKAGSRASARR